MIEAKPDAPSSSPPSSPATRQADGLSARNQAFREVLEAVGDFTLFALHAWGGLFRGHFSRLEWFRIAAEVGNASAPVVAITGAFIGMVLAVQAYDQFHLIGMETSLGAVIHMSLVRELGPVLASVMVAGRVGSAMAAEIATMRVSEQLDALTCLGLDPVHYLV
ncbi:MAG: ABC transporter permease, partial [Gemmataceae bacterium]|nr:ABC transporter permease [Gemmataceae bacterium]